MIDTSSVTHRTTSHKLPDGSEIVLCSFGLAEWSAVQEAALAYYKRSIIKTWSENADLLPEEIRSQEIRRAFLDAEKLSIQDLPRRTVKMPDTNENGQEVRDQNGKLIMKDIPTDYTSWWMSETLDGMLHCSWLSARKSPGQQQWSKQYVSDLFAQAGGDASTEIDQAATAVARLSRSELAGNSSAPPAPVSQEGTSQDRSIQDRTSQDRTSQQPAAAVART